MMRKTISGLSLLVILSIITGCVNNYPPPPSVLHADNYTSLTTDEQRMLPESEKTFTLEDAVTLGLANSPTFEKTSLAIQKAYNTFYGDLASYLPTASASYGSSISQSHSKAEGSSWKRTSSSGGSFAQTWDKSGSFSADLNFTIFNGLQREFDLLASYENVMEKEQAMKWARLSLINSIENQYYGLVLAKEAININEQNLQFQEQMLDIVKEQYKNDLVTYDYVLNFEFNYKSEQVSLVGAKYSFKQLQFVLAALLGLTTAEFPENLILQTPSDLLSGMQKNFSTLGVEFYLDIAIDQRPDLEESRATLKKARYDLYSAWGAFSPTLGAGGSYGNSNAQWLGGESGSNTQNLSYGLTASWDLIDSGFGRIFNVRNKQIEMDIKEQDVLLKWIDVVKTVRIAYLQLQTSIVESKLSSEAFSLAERQRDIVREKFDNQLESITRLNQVQTELIAMQLTNVTSIISVYQSRVDLNTACGIQRY